MIFPASIAIITTSIAIIGIIGIIGVAAVRIERIVIVWTVIWIIRRVAKSERGTHIWEPKSK